MASCGFQVLTLTLFLRLYPLVLVRLTYMKWLCVFCPLANVKSQDIIDAFHEVSFLYNKYV